MCYPPRQGTFRCITHPFATRHQGCPRAAVRLACVKHAASVQSEPGSNSSVQCLSARLASPLGSARPTGRSSSPDSANEPQLICLQIGQAPCAIHSNPHRNPGPLASLPAHTPQATTGASHQMPTPIGSLLTVFLKNNRPAEQSPAEAGYLPEDRGRQADRSIRTAHF
jgi:hypothetical protein